MPSNLFCCLSSAQWQQFRQLIMWHVFWKKLAPTESHPLFTQGPTTVTFRGISPGRWLCTLITWKGCIAGSDFSGFCWQAPLGQKKKKPDLARNQTEIKVLRQKNQKAALNIAWWSRDHVGWQQAMQYTAVIIGGKKRNIRTHLRRHYRCWRLFFGWQSLRSRLLQMHQTRFQICNMIKHGISASC